MSSDDVLTVRVDSLEESRREQGAAIKTITDSLHRIELALSQSVAKACPLPGHCVVLVQEPETVSSRRWWHCWRKTVLIQAWIFIDCLIQVSI